MKTALKHILVVIFPVVLLTGNCNLSQERMDGSAPLSFLLTWQKDPSTTMVIDWHMEADTYGYLEYRESGEEYWRIREGNLKSIPYSGRRLYRLELENLLPDQVYDFRFSGEGPVYRFRTMPMTLSRPVRFIATGDMKGSWDQFKGTGQNAMKRVQENLDFVVIGGDLAYADGQPDNIHRWFRYLRTWSEVMITEQNRVIPHLAAIGNHEVRHAYAHTYPEMEFNNPDFALIEAPFYSTFVAFPGESGYGVLDFGDYLSLFLLDSGHLNLVAGEQTWWLEQEMSGRRHMTHLIPAYHVTAWPSAREFSGRIESAIRRNWVPVFEEHGVRLALEHHDHTYKRTHPIRNQIIDETGVFYVGGGAWGVQLRDIRTDEEGNMPWYLAKAESRRHFIKVELHPDAILLNMYDETGYHFDELHIVHTGNATW